MAISTTTELEAAIGNWLAGRSDLASEAADFIMLAENYLNFGTDSVSPLRVREMEVVATLVPVDGVCTLPSDYLQYQRVVETSGTRRPLAYITPDIADVLYPSRASGVACHFTIIGPDLYTFPLAQNSIELAYYQALPPLASNASNWLLAKAPGVYLRAALVQAAEFVKDDAELAKQATMASALIAGLNRSDMLGKFARAGVVSRGVTP